MRSSMSLSLLTISALVLASAGGGRVVTTVRAQSLSNKRKLRSRPTRSVNGIAVALTI